MHFSLLEQLETLESNLMIVQELLTELELIVDSMEQCRERPGDNEEQKKYVSGNQKQHTFKNQVVSMPEAPRNCGCSSRSIGPTSDISWFRNQQQKFDAEQLFKGDKAYVGGTNISTPHKKPRNGELTVKQKAENKVFYSQRIFGEHIIRLIKVFRVAAERFRHPDTYEQVIFTVCGLVRLRIGSLVLPALS